MKYFKYLALAFFVYAFVGAGSSAAEKTTGSQPARQKSGDFVLVSNPRTPKNPGMRIVFNEDLTIGVKEGDENYMFGSRFLYINVDDDGNIYGVDWDRKRIQKYDPEGQYLLTIGRHGQGPGEFGNVWAPHFDKDNHLYVRDIVNHKVSFFDLNGTLAREIKMPLKAGDIQVNSRGEYVAYVNEEKSDPKLGMRVIFSHGLFDKDLNPLAVFQQTTWTPTPPSGRGPEAFAKYLGDSMSKGALGPEVTLVLARDDRIYVGFPETYEIRVYSPAGKPERLIRKDQPPQPVTEIHKKDYAARQERDFLFSFGDRLPESARKKALSMIQYPRFLPAYQTFSLLDNGWLAVVVDAIEGGPAKIDFFDEHGVYVAETSARIPVEGLTFKKGKAYAVETTEDGYKFVKRYSFEIRQN
jgi:hypothetical protein